MTPYYEHAGITIYHGDCREVLPTLETGSFSLVLTDPPYPRPFLPLYGAMATESARLLEVGGSLVTLCGHYQVPDVLDAMRPHLRYWWIGGMHHTTTQRLPGIWVAIRWKPALWFVNQRRYPGDTQCPVDLTPGGGKDKAYHEWGQPWRWFAHWIERLCRADGAVLDPFVGGGATLVAAKELGRRAVGCDIEERACEAAARRLEQEVFVFDSAADRAVCVECGGLGYERDTGVQCDACGIQEAA